MLKVVSPYKLLFVKDFVFQRFEVRELTWHTASKLKALHRFGDYTRLSSLEVRISIRACRCKLLRIVFRLGSQLPVRAADAIVSMIFYDNYNIHVNVT